MLSKKIVPIRLKKDFENLKQNGSRNKPSHWLMFSYKSNGLVHCRFGWTISGKVGNSIIRNRLKRWCREYFRNSSRPKKINFDVNIVLKPMGNEFYKNLKQTEFFKVLDKGWGSIVSASE